MLLRSYSAPISTSFLPHSLESSHDQQVPKTLGMMAKKDLQTHTPSKTTQKKKTTKTSSIKLFSCSDKQVLGHEEGGKKVGKLESLVMGDGGMGCDGGKVCGNGWENNYGRDEIDVYYQNMIEANPNNSLLLGNYAKFLKEVRGNYGKAEEYLERAILVNPGDANALSLYADLIWQTEKNVDRAEAYFDRAVKSDPDDCYVLASYAKFLWDVEEDEDSDYQNKIDKSHTYSPDHFQGTNGRSHVTAAS